MKTKYNLLLLILLIIAACSFGQLSPVYGPRKRVNIDALQPGDYFPGVLYIKLKPGFESILESNRNQTNPGSSTGIAKLDALSKKFKATKIESSFKRALKNASKASLHKTWALDRWLTVRIPENLSVKEAVKGYSALADVIEVAEPSYKRELFETDPTTLSWFPNDSAFNNQWNFNHTAQQGETNPPGIDADIDLPEAWDIETGKPQVIVAVLDGGIDTSHADIRQNLWIGDDGTRFGINWNNYGNPIEGENHGTHVAGIIGAVNNNTRGVCGIAGGTGSPSTGVRMMSMQIFTPTGEYAGDDAVANAFVYAADNGAAIAQNSWGGGDFSQIILDGVDYFIMNGGGSVLNGGLAIFSAGNKGSETEQFPAYYAPVLAVAGTDYSDKKSSYSSYGSWVDISAPGGDGSQNFQVLSTIKGGYGWLKGTSMAAPHVSGVAALCISKKQGVLSNDQLRNILLSTTDNIYPQNPGYTGKLGSGRLNAYHALQAAAAVSAPAINPVASFSASQDCGTVTLTWTKNTLSNNVMIARADTLLFGIPSGTLQTGDTLPGGGIIIYKGSGTSYLTSIPVQQRRYYRIWSYSGSQYSFYKTENVLFNNFVSNISASEPGACDIEITWEDDLSCPGDSVLLVASKSSSFSQPNGLYQAGDRLATGEKVIYKGNASSFTYTTDLDSTIYIKKWRFNDDHEYSDPSDNTPAFLNKPNAIEYASATGINESQMSISWVPAGSPNCFGGSNYLLAFNPAGEFGEPTGTYVPGDQIAGGGTVIYTGPSTAFIQSGLQENSNYSYKIWKVKNQAIYSFGKSFSGETLCNSGAITLPFHDSFEAGAGSDPDPCHWTIENYSNNAYPLTIVTEGDNPTAYPVEGNSMIRFYAYNTSAGEEARLSSAPVKKGSGKSMDISFRWLQDSSNYTGEEYRGEGVLVQWSKDKTNWKDLEFYPRVPDGGDTGWSYKQLTLPDQALNTDTVYIGLLFTSGYGNNCYLDNLKLQVSSYKPADNTTATAVCEFTDSTSMFTHFYDNAGNRLLSIKKNGQDIGKAGHSGYDLRLGPSGVSTIVPNSNYVTNPGGWISMNRYFLFHPITEPASKINIRYYYFTQDFNNLATAANSLSPARPSLLHTDLYGWKINDIPQVYDLNPVNGHIGIPKATVYNGNAFAQYANGSLPDTTTWKYTSIGNGLHSMEYTTTDAGGGALGIGSESGKGAFQLITYTFTGNGNWSTSSNWANSIKPPSVLPNNGLIIIDPLVTGECVLDVVQTVPSGASVKVQPGKKFRVKTVLQIKK